MEKFMLIFQGGMPSENPSPEFMQAQMGKWMAWIEKLSKAGKYVSGEPLLPGGKLIKGKSKISRKGSSAIVTVSWKKFSGFSGLTMFALPVLTMRVVFSTPVNFFDSSASL